MTTTELTALLAADLTDASNRAVLADALEELGRDKESRLLRAGPCCVECGAVMKTHADTFGELCGRIGLDVGDWRHYGEVLKVINGGRSQTKRYSTNPSAYEALAWVRAGRPRRKMTRREASALESHS